MTFRALLFASVLLVPLPARGQTEQSVATTYDEGSKAFTITIAISQHDRDVLLDKIIVDLDSTHGHLPVALFKKMGVKPSGVVKMASPDGKVDEFPLYRLDVKIGPCRFSNIDFVGVLGSSGGIGNNLLRSARPLTLDPDKGAFTFACSGS